MTVWFWSSGSSQTRPANRPTVIALSSFGDDSLPILEVAVGSRRVRFILDFGAGITVISKQLCDTLGCRVAGRMAGVRHTGEVVELSLVSVPSLELGPIRQVRFLAAVMDLTAWQQVAPVAGVLSLQTLEHTPFTLDMAGHRLILNPGTTIARPEIASHGHVAVIRQHPATVEVQVPVFVAGQPIGWGQLDTGSPQTYIHAWWKPLLGQHGRRLDTREQRSWTGRRDSVEYWRVGGLAVLDTLATGDSATVEVGTIVPDAVIGLDWLRRGLLSCDLRRSLCSFTRVP